MHCYFLYQVIGCLEIRENSWLFVLRFIHMTLKYLQKKHICEGKKSEGKKNVIVQKIYLILLTIVVAGIVQMCICSCTLIFWASVDTQNSRTNEREGAQNEDEQNRMQISNDYNEYADTDNQCERQISEYVKLLLKCNHNPGKARECKTDTFTQRFSTRMKETNDQYIKRDDKKYRETGIRFRLCDKINSIQSNEGIKFK